MNLLPNFLVHWHPDEPPAPCGNVLERARKAIRNGDTTLAEEILLEGGDAIRSNAACLNVLGLIAEARGQWRQARRCWRQSLCADGHYEPPRQNLRRYFEFFQFGKSSVLVAFGDEPEFLRQEARRERC
jgi:hypothetical protein